MIYTVGSWIAESETEKGRACREKNRENKRIKRGRSLKI